MIARRYIFRFIAVTTLLISAPELSAQEAGSKNSAFLSVGIETPVGGNNFTSEASIGSPMLGYEYRFASKFSIGASFGFSHSDEKVDVSRYDFDWDNVTTTVHRKLTLMPIQADFRYYFPMSSAMSALHPYLGLSAGVQYAKFYITADVITTSGRESWAEVITPNAGLRYHPGQKGLYADLRVEWKYSGNAWQIANNNKSQQSIGVRLGVGYSF